MSLVLKRNTPSVTIVWLAIATFVGYLSAILWNAQRTYESKIGDQALSIVRLVEQHASSKIERADFVLAELAADHCQPADFMQGRQLAAERRRQIEKRLRDYQQRTRGIASISLADADGYVFANSMGIAPGRNLGDRKYFLELKAQPRNSPAISEVLRGRISNKWGIQIARRIDLGDGSFGGAIVADLEPAENFEKFYKSISLDKDSIITLRDAENRLLVRYPTVEETFGRILTGSEGTRRVLAGEAESVITSQSTIDQIVRITAVRRLPDYPIFAIVGLSKEVALDTWYKELLVALYVMAGALLAGLFITYAMGKREQALLELEDAHGRLNGAHKLAAEAHRQLEVANAALTRSLAEAERCASHDKLTGLWNRRAFDQRLDETVARAERLGLNFSLLMFDIDHFKRINDAYGHLVGDTVLYEFATVISGRIRASDIFARWGGEEFILLVEATDADQAVVLAEDLRAAIAGHSFSVAGKLTVSIGIAEYRADEGLEDVLRRADRSLYAAKAEGRNRVKLG